MVQINVEYIKAWYCCLLIMLLLNVPAKSQTHEVQQLLLNVEKLAQVREILKNIQDGYQILNSLGRYNDAENKCTKEGIGDLIEELTKRFLSCGFLKNFHFDS